MSPERKRPSTNWWTESLAKRFLFKDAPFQTLVSIHETAGIHALLPFQLDGIQRHDAVVELNVQPLSVLDDFPGGANLLGRDEMSRLDLEFFVPKHEISTGNVGKTAHVAEESSGS